MPVAEQLNVRMTADVKNAVAGIKDFSNELGKVPPQVAKTQRALNATSGAVQKSGKDFTNFGRVIQDLPYGFTGIQNNLTQLIPAAGALGLAFTGIVTAITFMQIGFGAWTRGMGKSKEEADELKKKLKELIIPIEEIRDAAAGGVEGEISLVKSLSSVILDQTKSYKERNRALGDLKEINKEYFGDMTLEEAKLRLLTSRVEEYTSALISEAVVKAFQDDIGKVSVELTKQQKELGKSVSKVNEYRKAIEAAEKSQNRVAKSRSSVFGEQTFQVKNVTDNLNQALDAFKKQKDIVKQLGVQKEDLQTALNDAVGEGLKLKPLTKTGPEAKEKKIDREFLFQFLPFDPSGKLNAKQKATIVDAMDKFSKEFSGILEGIEFTSTNSTTQGAIDAANKWWKDFQNGLVTFKPQSFDIGPIPIVEPEIDPAIGERFRKNMADAIGKDFKVDDSLFGAAFDRKAILKKFEDQFKSIGESLPKELQVGAVVQLIDQVTSLDALKKGLQELYDKAKTPIETLRIQVNAAISSGLSSGLAGIGEGIGQAIAAGGSVIEAAGRSILGAVGDLITQIGKALIEYGIVKQGLDAILAAGIAIPGVAAIVAGTAAVAIGSLIKAAAFKPKPFAEGGLVYGPTLGLVGEGSGTSRSNPEVIAPLDKLKNIIGGTNNQVEVVGEFELRGDKLVAVIQKTNQRHGRAYGR
jgi:archaellum component FlaC